MAEKGKIGIIGSGFIGRGWAMIFASVGYRVSLYDVEISRISDALLDIEQQLKTLEDTGLLRGCLTAEQQFANISKCSSLKECVEDSIHVQECVFENLDLKKKVYKELDELASDTVTLCSSTSCLPASSFSEDLKHRAQVIVGHPVNPPYYVPLVEIVPTPWTDPSIVQRTRELMLDIGQKPVLIKKEVPGFAVNRLQYAILNECWRIVQDGIMSVEDVETSICDGLGLRYAFIGPLETCHLNADGFLDYCRRYAKGIYDVSQTFGPNVLMEGDVAKMMHDQLCEISPLENICERRKWREARLAALATMKKRLNEEDGQGDK